MKSSTAYNHSVRWAALVRNILTIARSCGASHEWILQERRATLYSDPAWIKAPGWARQSAEAAFAAGMSAMYQPIVSASELDRREARIRAGMDVDPLPFVRWFLSYVDADGNLIHCTEWGELPDYVRDSACVGGDGCLFTGAHRWNHIRANVY